MLTAHPDFPAPRAGAIACPTPDAGELRLRPCSRADLPFLRHLYGELRTAELDRIGWPAHAREAFLDSQFAFQHQHFVSRYANADFWIVEYLNVAVGRYYLLRDAEYFRVVDVALRPRWRRLCIGSGLLTWAQSLARDSGIAGIDLHVEARNAGARRLYARLGFVETSRQLPYIGMRWRVPNQLNIA